MAYLVVGGLREATHFSCEDTGELTLHGEGKCGVDTIAIRVGEPLLDVSEERERTGTVEPVVRYAEVCDVRLNTIVEHVPEQEIVGYNT